MNQSFSSLLGHKSKLFTSVVVVGMLAGCGGSDKKPTVQPEPEPNPAPVKPAKDHSGLTPLTASEIISGEHLAGGAVTSFIFNSEAFEQRALAVAGNFSQDANFTAGDHIFRTPHDGMGPLMNAASCQGCHLKDGRGVVPASPVEAMRSMFLRIGDSQGNPDPVYGGQLQTFAVQSFTTSDRDAGLPKAQGSINGDELYGEAFAFIKYETINGQYADGESYQLRKPTYYVKDLSFGEFNGDVRLSPRVTPSVFGAGLLEVIKADTIVALADPDDSNNDGISGRAVFVNETMTGEQKLGRFGYKSTNPTVLQQSAGAYRGDMGITNSLFKQEPCTELQVACLSVAEQETTVGEDIDITDRELALVEFYTRVLAVPARRGFDTTTEQWQADVTAGRTLFFNSGCVDCHTPRHVTGEAPGSLLGEVMLSTLLPDAEPLDYLANQTIYPYTDLLLHDMGGSCKITRELADGASCTSGNSCMYVQRCEGLADDRPEGQADGREWKTPALWGLGLVKTVNPKATFLHDGRARTIAEAILWHGGEASNSQKAFVNLSKVERDQLLSFLNSL
ncbi:di-heme oxidoredictase family protein [Psychrobium sp. 1_MG-2023]|uniref:di-heme oxidoreductase family protein n=1 Tax=Psychrobium sp. 1_MG-2023 TaxID=3062624 RepID=UPI000C3300D8|nr:di-heme oxidoredictase family protein [Psychrobium sp. 1_MG-2023]MDP2562873.1 di-heme oxidoredictase family protein [Psychrobium sp. 1_MG-2023]PKF57150.1 thiol oxidoreductase [Alteromonadales bacterium alter-6D02]